jgi:hypothetical protein
MGLPTDRNRTYVIGTPVAPADLNDLQDAVKYGWHGQIVHRIVPRFGLVVAGAPTINGNELELLVSCIVDVEIPRLTEGMRIVSATLHYKRAAGTLTFALYQGASNGSAATSLASRVDSTTGVDTTIVMDATHVDSGSMPQIQDANGPLFFRLSTGAAGDIHVYWLDLVIDVGA